MDVYFTTPEDRALQNAMRSYLSRRRQTTIPDFSPSTFVPSRSEVSNHPASNEGAVPDDDASDAWETEEEEEEDHSDASSSSSSSSISSSSSGYETDTDSNYGSMTYESLEAEWAEEERRRWSPLRQKTLVELFGWTRAREIDPEPFSVEYYVRAFGYGYERAEQLADGGRHIWIGYS